MKVKTTQMKLRKTCICSSHTIPSETDRKYRKEALKHPRCVGLGETGLDYHYDNSPRDIQQLVLRRQLKLAIEHGKPLTIHTREAEEDTERILKEEVPSDWKVRYKPDLCPGIGLTEACADSYSLFH